MSCKRCQSGNQRNFGAEIAIHFPGFNSLTKPAVFAFPTLVICFDCGFSEFLLREAELQRVKGSETSDKSQERAS